MLQENDCKVHLAVSCSCGPTHLSFFWSGLKQLVKVAQMLLLSWSPGPACLMENWFPPAPALLFVSRLKMALDCNLIASNYMDFTEDTCLFP